MTEQLLLIGKRFRLHTRLKTGTSSKVDYECKSSMLGGESKIRKERALYSRVRNPWNRLSLKQKWNKEGSGVKRSCARAARKVPSGFLRNKIDQKLQLSLFVHLKNPYSLSYLLLFLAWLWRFSENRWTHMGLLSYSFQIGYNKFLQLQAEDFSA